MFITSTNVFWFWFEAKYDNLHVIFVITTNLVGSNDRTRNAVAAADAANSVKIIVEEKRPKRAGQSAKGKKKRNQRTMFSEQQLTALEQSFRSKAYLTLDDRAILSKQLGIPEKTVSLRF